MRVEPLRWMVRGLAVMLIALTWCIPGSSQQVLNIPEIPRQFKFDMQVAARMRPQLMAASIPANGRYLVGRIVFDRLLKQVTVQSDTKFAWQLRIVEDDLLNAYSSPDGTVYVESGLARLAGVSPGPWAAILSHEIAHVVRRDWARRYLYEKSLQGDGGVILLGDPGLPSGSWTTAEKASEELARFCRALETAADREGLMLMARAGYHPDFVPALHHLLHAYESGAPSKSLYSMHPCWEERDRELGGAYLEASIAFDHRWREWYASPGGNPPVVVFAEQPRIRKSGSKGWDIQIPMRCQNLVGAVEVVLRAQHGTGASMREHSTDGAASHEEVSQLTGCTSPITTVTFAIEGTSERRSASAGWTDVYVLDAWGSVLARAGIPKTGR